MKKNLLTIVIAMLFALSASAQYNKDACDFIDFQLNKISSSTFWTKESVMKNNTDEEVFSSIIVKKNDNVGLLQISGNPLPKMTANAYFGNDKVIMIEIIESEEGSFSNVSQFYVKDTKIVGLKTLKGSIENWVDFSGQDLSQIYTLVNKYQVFYDYTVTDKYLPK